MSSILGFLEYEGRKAKRHGNDVSFQSGVVRLKQKFTNMELRRSLFDFSGCFCVSSISGGVLRTATAELSALNFESAPLEFSSCNHISGTPWIEPSPESGTCDDSSMQILKESMKSFDEIPSATSLGIIICNTSLSNSNTRLPVIAKSIARSKYMEKFEEERNGEIVQYSNEHWNGLNPP